MYKDPKCGIYKITNKLNQKCYIGQSNRIHARWAEHKREAFDEETYPKEYNKALYMAFRKYGIENFEFEILEETDSDRNVLLEREKYYIEKYNSFNNGYNCTEGGEVGNYSSGESHANHKLSKEDVIKIRTAYRDLIYWQDIYDQFSNKVTKSGFKKVFYGETWKDIMMEVYTPERKEYYINLGKEVAIKNSIDSNVERSRTKRFKTEDMVDIIIRCENGENFNKIIEDYSDYNIDYIKKLYNDKKNK